MDTDELLGVSQYLTIKEKRENQDKTTKILVSHVFQSEWTAGHKEGSGCNYRLPTIVIFATERKLLAVSSRN
jgi:hypothetical protein